jgi:ent-kaurene synthase
MFNKVELSVSSYDTAWVAMIPSSTSLHAPFFPQCLNWLLDNQLADGSWGLPDRHPLLTNDALLSTLACILALKQWGIGEDKMNKGTLIFSHLSSFDVRKAFRNTKTNVSVCLLFATVFCLIYTLLSAFAGLEFIESNLTSINDDKQHHPIGFDILFPSLIEYAQTLGINIATGATSVEAMIQKRDKELQR